MFLGLVPLFTIPSAKSSKNTLETHLFFTKYWCLSVAIYGDLNELSDPLETLSACKGNSTRYIKFNNFINTNVLIDNSCLCFHFTCILRSKESCFVWLANVNWLMLYLPAVLNNILVIRSDQTHLKLMPPVDTVLLNFEAK